MMKRNFQIKTLLILLIALASASTVGQDCSITSKANDIIPDRLCAPVSVDWEVTYRGVNNAGTSVQFEFDWDDGNIERVNATLTDLPTREWKIVQNHIYPIGGNQCNYTATVTLVVNNVICGSSLQEQIITVWDTDDLNGGELQITRNPHPICVGNSDFFNFTDVSQWNCTPPDENDVINNKSRWIQWIYGTNSGDAEFMNDTEVDGATRAWPYRGNIEATGDDVWGPAPPINTSLNIYVPNYYPVGSTFQVTLRNWNYCNPYDDPDTPGLPADPINGDFPPVTTTAIALIVDNPDATITQVGPFCNNSPQLILTAATTGGIWSGNGITDTNAGLFDPSVAGAGNHQINYVVTDGNGCNGNHTIFIEVIAGPTVNITSNTTAELCPGIILELEGNPAGGQLPYTDLWTGDTAPLSATDLQSPEFQTNNIDSYELIYRVTDGNGCRAEDTITVEVDSVSIAFDTEPITACTGEPKQINTNATGGSGTFVEYRWSGTDTDKLSATDLPNPVFTSLDEGTFKYEFYVRDQQGCDNSDSISIVVNQLPEAQAGTDGNACGLEYFMAANPSTGSSKWESISGPGIIDYTDINSPVTRITADTYGDYNFNWIETNLDCADTATLLVSFHETPHPSVMNDADTCALQYQLKANSTHPSGTWRHVSGPGTFTFDNATNDTTNVTVNTPGQYQFEWFEDNGFGCTGSDTVTILFNQIPQADVAPFPLTACSPLQINFTNQSQNADTYFWDFGDGFSSNFENPTHTYENNTSLQKNLELYLAVSTDAGCTDTIKYNIEVAPNPFSLFTMDITKDCSPLEVNFTNLSERATSYLWEFGDGSVNSTITDVTHIFQNNENFIQAFEIKLAALNTYGCSDTSSQYVTVYPLQDFQFVADPDTGCHPLSTNITADPGAFSYEWDLGDGTTTSGIYETSHIFENTLATEITLDITLITSSFFNCMDTTIHPITIYPSSKANMTPDNNNGCAPVIINYSNTSTGTSSSLWKFGDGIETLLPGTASPAHTFNNNSSIPVNYTTWLITNNSFDCKDSVESIIEVFPLQEFPFTADPDTGCHPLKTNFNATPGALTYQWNFGDGNTITGSFETSHSFTNSLSSEKNYNITLTTTSIYNCLNTTNSSVVVLPTTTAGMAMDKNSGCTPLTINFTNTSSGANQSSWIFGDGTEINHANTPPISHTYTNNGSTPASFTTKLLINNPFNCKDSTENIIEVFPLQEFPFSAKPDTGCAPLFTTFNATEGATSYEWNYGDGNSTSGSALSTHLFTNNSNQLQQRHVQLIAKSIYNCPDTTNLTVVIYPTPKAKMSTNTNNGCAPLSIKYTNTSIGANRSIWDFGDGTIISHPLTPAVNHTFTNRSFAPVIIRPKLTVTNTYQCKDSTDHLLEVFPLINAKISEGKEGCSPLKQSFLNETLGASTFEWDYGDGNSSSDYLGQNIFTNSTNTDLEFTVSMIASSVYNCSDTTYTKVKVLRTPIPAFTVFPIEQQMPNATIEINNQTLYDPWDYFWDFADGRISTKQQPLLHTYTISGNYNIQLKVVGESCSDSLTKGINIIPGLPVIDYGPPAEGCPPIKVQFYNNTTDANNYMWEFGDGNISSEVTPKHTYHAPGIYNVKLTAQGPGGNRVVDDLFIEVYPTPTAYFDPIFQRITIPGQSAKFRNLSEGASLYEWDFGDTHSSNEFAPTHEYETPGVYDVTLYIKNDQGCEADYTILEAVKAEAGGELDMPNAFTPDPNGPSGGLYEFGERENFIFYPYLREGVIEFNMQIFTRWGELIFESKNINIGWDGYYRGRMCAQGVYIWKVTVKYATGETKVLTGDVTLLR